jgi:hypothetical protein
MAQVISLQQHKRHPHERLATAMNALCAVAYVLGFFVAGPILLMFGFAFAFVWAVTKAAYTRLSVDSAS